VSLGLIIDRVVNILVAGVVLTKEVLLAAVP